MYLLYADDSGVSSDPSVKYSVLAGFATFESQTFWIQKAVDEIMLRHTGRADLELHASPIRSGKGIWRGFPKDKREAILKDTLGYIKENYPRLFDNQRLLRQRKQPCAGIVCLGATTMKARLAKIRPLLPFAFLLALLLVACATREKLGDIVEKEVTVNGEKQVRKLMYQSLTEYDGNGKPIYYNLKNQYETWREYDADGNAIHYKTSLGEEEWYEYDGRGNKIHERHNDGVEVRAEYDDRGNMIHIKGDNVKEQYSEYDESGNETRRVLSDGGEILYEYDEKGKKVCIKVLIGGKVTEEYRNEYDYDEKGNCIHSVEPIENMERWMEYDSARHPVHVYNHAGLQVWHEYDADGNEIYYKIQYKDSVKERRTEYDAAGRKTRQTDTDGTEYLWEYDAGGNCVYENQGGGTEIFYEYDFHPNGKIKAKREYTSNL